MGSSDRRPGFGDVVVFRGVRCAVRLVNFSNSRFQSTSALVVVLVSEINQTRFSKIQASHPIRHRIQFPPIESHLIPQDEVYFHIVEQQERYRLRFHDYAEIYKRAGLYEQLFCERLKCSSPQKVGEILQRTVVAAGERLSELRVLDLGAGNGMMGEVLKQEGVARLIGADIIPEARDAADRDRPGVYDDFYVADFTNLSQTDRESLSNWSINCLTTVAALGFGDIPPLAFLTALQFVQNDGWVAFNIKETFLERSDTSGFSKFIRELIFSKYLELFHLEKYRHRLSMEGTPLFYYALVARKRAEIPKELMRDLLPM